MRLTTVVPLVVLLVTAILTLSVLGLRYERARLLADFAADQEETAGQLSSDLGREPASARPVGVLPLARA